LQLISQKPSIVCITLERPAIIPDIAKASKGLIADFGVTDDVLADIISGRFNPAGKLPFFLPSSQKSVEKQQPDMPYDLRNPLYYYGHGLSY